MRTVARAVFCAGTLLAAIAPVLEVLLVAGVVQAVGKAVMMPLLMTSCPATHRLTPLRAAATGLLAPS